MKQIVTTLCVVLSAAVCVANAATEDPGLAAQWSPEKAAAWYAQQPWQVGGNYATSTAINQLEMWQAETFDPKAIDRELGWAAAAGMNTMRVFLHDMLWQQDAEGFLNRLDAFLAIADKHGIRPMLVLFDAVWDSNPTLGTQRAPKPHVHNSGWVQSPHLETLKDPAKQDALEPYVKGVLERFKNDSRILMWDLYNEPGNGNGSSYGKLEAPDKEELSMQLLERVFRWARQVNPSQPLTAGVWTGDDWNKDGNLSPLNRYMLQQSDIITFHTYSGLETSQKRVASLKSWGRPLICTEYMARTAGCTFAEHLPYFKQQKIGAIHWGLIAGKSQTQYPWESWQQTFTEEPKVWFHDVFRADGTPFDAADIALFKSLTGKEQPADKSDISKTPVVRITTSMGIIEIELNAEKAPISVENFLTYVKSGFYNGTIFHRVMPKFMIQGGGFTPDMQQKATRSPIKNEAANGLKNLRGTLAMARTPIPDSATSQFFINQKDNVSLDYRGPQPDRIGYAVFGKVTKGMDVVDKIAAVPTTWKGLNEAVPVAPVIIQSVEIVNP